MNIRRQEYAILLDLLAKANNSVKMSSISDVSEHERLLDAHNLANKFIGHALTILHLSHGTLIQDLPSFNKLNFPDSASIDVLTRAAMEAFLVFHFVFYAPKTKEEKEFRYLTHKAIGLAERQNLPPRTLEHKRYRYDEKKKLEEILRKLGTNIIFRGVPEIIKNQFIKGKNRDLWRWNPDNKKILPLPDIAVNAGLSETLALHLYKHLSGYAHSGSLSIIQTAQALVNKEVDRLIQPSMNAMMILTANMINEYCEMFSEAQAVLKESGASNFVQIYVEVGKKLDENSHIT